MVEVKKFNQLFENNEISDDAIVCIYEQGEIGFGYGLYFVRLGDFDITIPEQKQYYNSIISAITHKDQYGYGSSNSNIYFHNISENYDNIDELYPPINIDYGVYIFIDK